MDKAIEQFQSVLVPHSKFEEAIRRMEQNFTYAQQASEIVQSPYPLRGLC